MSDSIDKMLSVANGIAQGKAGKDFIYSLEEDKFYMYTKGYWKQLSDIEIMRIILDTYSGQNNMCDIRFSTVSRRRQILENLKMLIFKHISDFNRNGYLNFDLGEFDPATGYMHNHDKESYSTLRVSYPYHASAKCELWLKTIAEIFEGDQSKVDILQEFFGYCLTRDTRKEKALLLLGESRTGKSTILETLSAVLGEENCAFVSLDYICHPQYSPLLMNKLVNIDTDVSGKAENFEREFKTITSGEPLVCNQKFVETFKFRPYCKLVLACNEFPAIKDHSSAFYKRLILLPCDRVFEENEQNIALKDLLTLELSGIFNWAVEGLQRLNKRGGFERKEFMNEAVEELRLESNPAERFFEEFIEIKVADDTFIEKGEMYERYKAWAQSNQYYVLNLARFSQAVYRKYSKVTPKKAHTLDKRIWRNIDYKNKNHQPQEHVMWDRED